MTRRSTDTTQLIGAEPTTEGYRGFVPWSPQAENRELVAQIKSIMEEYRDYLPLTIRQIYYRLVAQYSFPKTRAITPSSLRS